MPDGRSHGRSRCVAPEGRAGLLPIPRCSREHDAVAHLQTSRVQAMAECSGPPQSARTDALGTFYPSPEPVDSSTPRSAPLPRRTLLRHSSLVRAVCVDALVRIWAGGDQRWSSLPRQLGLTSTPTTLFRSRLVGSGPLHSELVFGSRYEADKFLANWCLNRMFSSMS